MAEFWEAAFADKQLMWGLEPTRSAFTACELFTRAGARDVLIPGFGYGRNAKPFIDAGMQVTGIEISQTAITLAREQLGLRVPIFHGSVTAMPFDASEYDAVFCFGLLYLLDAPSRAKVLADCARQLRPGGHLFFTVISKQAPMYGQGRQLGEDLFERAPGLPMFFYDAASIRREFEPHGLVELTEVDEPTHGSTLPFFNVVCRR